ncbi:MAG: M15 family metallopeptidase [Gemmatimonadota bacterium]
MILFLPATNPTPDMSSAQAPGDLGPDGEVSLEPVEVPAVMTGIPESASFPAVLLALAGLGVSMDGRPSPTPPVGARYDPEAAQVNETLAEADTPPVDLVLESIATGVGFSAVGVSNAPSDDPDQGQALLDAFASAVEASADAPTATEAEEFIEAEDETLVRATLGQVADTVTLAPGMLRRLSPDFVDRLERVAERMWDEYGMRVEIVEGFRSQTRQNDLFAQGRTAPGPVVTWTTNSLHTAGAAADLFVNGAPITIDQAGVLARVAEEEGLRTLYPFDSGHIQLDRPGYQADMEGPIERQPRPGATAPAAPPARGTARVAPVAPVARPARPGGSESPLAHAGPQAPSQRAPLEPFTTGPNQPASTSDAQPVLAPREVASRGPLPGGLAPQGEGVTEPGALRPNGTKERMDSPTPDRVDPVLARSGEPVALPSANPSTLGITARGSVQAVDGAELAGPRPVDPSSAEYTTTAALRRLHLPIDGVPGAASMDLGLRGGVVDGWLNVSDPALAAELRRSLHELKQQLSERGVEARALGVRLVQGTPVDAVAQSTDSGGARLAGEGSHGQEAEAERQRSQRDRTFRDARERAARQDQQDHKEER